MGATLERYRVHNAQALSTPALLIYSEMIDANIAAALRMMNGDVNRWRPHLKTAKLGYTMRRMVEKGVLNAKCATTLELISAIDAGMEDVVLAFPVMGANAARVREIAAAHPDRKISVLVEGPEQLNEWRGSSIGIFIDLNSGMNRTGMAEERFEEVRGFVEQVLRAGLEFRGLHHYDGHIHNTEAAAATTAYDGYAKLLGLIEHLEKCDINVGEVITSGTPAMPHALKFAGFNSADFVHRVSPGTIIYNDRSSLKELPGYGFLPAALVLATVVSQPMANRVTCDAGHKAVAADAGVPTCEALGWPGLVGLKPSEEHLPMDAAAKMPARGDMLYLLPTHVCPTVNNFDKAVIIRDGKVETIEPVTARGREVFVRSAAGA
ncbi:MAG TPA: alanine racemase [Bryobacteraceae bacterium]|jgi:D-serine deaminase-like pyridoxal phosphate-dependent protein